MQSQLFEITVKRCTKNNSGCLGRIVNGVRKDGKDSGYCISCLDIDHKNWQLAEIAKTLYGRHRVRKEAHGRYLQGDFTIEEQAAIVVHASGKPVKERKPEEDNPWKDYEDDRDKYRPASSSGRPSMEGGEFNSLPRTSKPYNERRKFPTYVIRSIAKQNQYTCPITELKEGTMLQNKYNGLYKVVELEGDHIIPWNKHNTTKENLQVIANVANKAKGRRTGVTNEQIKKQVFDTYRVVELTELETIVLKKFGYI